MPENIQRKVITEGLNLVIIKQLPQLFIEFHIENLTEDEYLVQFGFKDLQNVAPKNNETQVRAQVTPNSVVKITELVIKGSFAYKYQFAYQKLNQEPKEKIIEIVHGLNLKITQVDIQQKVLFELQSLRHEVSHLELTFTELNGITTQNNQTKFKIELAPKTNGSICELRFQGQMSYMYSYKFWFTQQPVDLKNLRKKLDMKIVESKNLFQGIDIDTLSIEEISYMLADSRFIDPQFSPVDYSIYANTKTVNVLQ